MTETPSIAGTRGRIPQAAVKSLLAIATVVLFAAGCARDDPARVEGAETTVSESTGAGEVITTSTVHAKDDGHDEGASHADDVEAAHDEPDVPIDEPAATTLPEGIDLVVQVDMLEFGYELDTPTIPVGSTVRFDFVNEGGDVASEFG